MIERALETEDDKGFVYGFEHWTANYDESADFDRFCDLLINLPGSFAEDNRHSLKFAITHRMFNRIYDDPRTYGHLGWVYNNTYCTNNSEKILRPVGFFSNTRFLIENHH